MNYVELIVATLSGLPEGERKLVLEEVAARFGYVVGHDVKAQKVKEAKEAKVATIAGLAKGQEGDFAKAIFELMESRRHGGGGKSVLQKPSDLLRGRK